MTSTPTNNACGDLDDYTRRDRQETITEPWTWEVEEGECGVTVERQNDTTLEQYANVCPSRVVVGNNQGRLQLKSEDSGKSSITAFEDQLSFADINNPDGVTLAELVACCDGGTGGGGGTAGPGAGTNAVQMINFPNAGTFSYETGVQTKTYWDASEESTLGPYNGKWNDTALYDVFDKEANKQVVTMPEGTNAAVLFFAYGVTITPTELVPDTQDGYTNVSYNMEITDNKSSVVSSPGALAAPVRVRTTILGWDQAKLIGQDAPGGVENQESIRRKRAPGLSSTGYKAVRIRFSPSGADADATKITLKPSCNVQRVRRCKATVGSGRVVCIPFFDDGSNFTPQTFFAEGEDYDDLVTDDGVVDIAFEEQQESVELKELMNYYLTSISETLNYDANLDPEGIPILQKALSDIFALKQLTGSTPEYYYIQLDAIRTSVVPYVAFQFGFETQVPETFTF
jgi:hypothetical protein